MFLRITAPGEFENARVLSGKALFPTGKKKNNTRCLSRRWGKGMKEKRRVRINIKKKKKNESAIKSGRG